MESGGSSSGAVASAAASSSTSSSMDGKPVVVRVKRKSFQAPLEAFWLEINERPLKRPHMDFSSLSISDSNGKEELKTKKLLVQHLESANSSKDVTDILHSVMPDSADAKALKKKLEERRRLFKQVNKQEHMRSVSRQKHEDLAKSARFEQIWKSRKRNEETMHDGFIHEFCHLYDIVRVDVEDKTSDNLLMAEQEKRDASLDEDDLILCNYLPMIRELLPSVASEIESEFNASTSKEDDYVYDLYTVEEDSNTTAEYASANYPLVQVEDDDDCYLGPLESDFETDDSNAEDNPRNNYPDESSEDEEEFESGSSSYQTKDDSPEEDDNEEVDAEYYRDRSWVWEHR